MRWSVFAVFALLPGTTAAGHPIREITIANAGNQQPLVLLLVPSGADCRGPLTARRAPRPFRLTGPCSGSASIAVFSPDRAAVLVEVEELRRAGRQLRITLKPALRLPVQVWYDAPNRRENAVDEIANTNWIFRRNRVGMVLEAAYNPLPAGSGDFDCSNPPPAPAFRPERINIYFGSGASATCPGHDRVFVKASDGLGTLAHEIAHALGVDSPDGDPQRIYDSQGHTGGFDSAPRDPAPFDGANALWRRSLIFRDSFTLGQVFWMNFNATGAFPAYRKANGFASGIDCQAAGQCVFFRSNPTPPLGASARGRRLPNLPCPQARIAVESTPEAIRSAIVARLIDRPRYCTQAEVRSILEQRWQEVCASGQCGSASKQDFVARWADRSGGIAAWVSDEGARIFAMRHSFGCDAACRKRAEQTERTVIGYVTSDLITGIRDKRILWLDDPALIKPEADVFRKLLVRIDSVRDPGATYSLIIANPAAAGPLLKNGTAGPPLILYQPGQPYASALGPEAKEEARRKGAMGLTDCPLELYNLAVGKLLEPKQPG